MKTKDMAKEGDEILAANRMVGFAVIMFFATAMLGSCLVAALLLFNRPDIYIQIIQHMLARAQ